jgi:putative glycerol-1-phosphate prenyltransferase
MSTVYENIVKAKGRNEKLLAVLIDPDKVKLSDLAALVARINTTITTHIFVGGSTVDEGKTERVVVKIKALTHLPVTLFPGSYEQITNTADALLFLSLLSGRNPEYLIGQQVKAIANFGKPELETIATGYLLISGGVETAVQRVSGTMPIAQTDHALILNTAIAGELLGNKLIYLEAGSGALEPVAEDIIKKVSETITIPLIVGGGIRSVKQLKKAYTAGADLVVIGTAIERNSAFLKELQ